MKHIKRDFSLKAWVRACLVDLGGGAEVKFKLFQNMIMLHIKLKIVSEYDQEIPQSQTADSPLAPQGRAAQPSRDTRKTN